MIYEGKRSEVIKLRQNGLKTSEIVNDLKVLKINRRFVQRSVKRFNETGSSADRPKIGRPRTSGTRRLKKLSHPEFQEILRDQSEKCPENSRFLELPCFVSLMTSYDWNLTKDVKFIVWQLIRERRDSIDPKFWSGGSLVTIWLGYCSLMRKYSRLKKRQTTKTAEFSPPNRRPSLKTSGTSVGPKSRLLWQYGLGCLKISVYPTSAVDHSKIVPNLKRLWGLNKVSVESPNLEERNAIKTNALGPPGGELYQDIWKKEVPIRRSWNIGPQNEWANPKSYFCPEGS